MLYILAHTPRYKTSLTCVVSIMIQLNTPLKGQKYPWHIKAS
jgi:hypothetical protein